MDKKKEDIIVLSVGGSLIIPDKIDVDFLKSFKDLILSQTKKKKKFVVIAGGGKIARNYQEALDNLMKAKIEEKDWLGIKATHLNALLVKTYFGKNAYPVVVENPTKKINFKEKVLVAGGWKPGFSTDTGAVLLAKNLKAKTIINLSNIDYAYNKDPKKFSDAKIIEKTTWKEFRKILPKKWSPGLNSPFDPIASIEAEKNKMKVLIMNGKDIKNLENYLEGREYKGTTIE